MLGKNYEDYVRLAKREDEKKKEEEEETKREKYD